MLETAENVDQVPEDLSLWQQFWGVAQSILPIIIIAVLFYFILIRPQRKQEKETKEMRSSLEVGDYITTIGGIYGRVVSIKDDQLVIETGADKSKIRIMKWAIQARIPAENAKAE